MTDATTPDIYSLKTFVGAKNFDLSRRFYSALGWTVADVIDGLAEARLSHFRFYLQRYYHQDWCHNTMMFMDVRDAAAWRQRIDAVITSDEFDEARATGPKDEGYAMVTHMWDPSGVLWHIAQSK